MESYNEQRITMHTRSKNTERERERRVLQLIRPFDLSHEYARFSSSIDEFACLRFWTFVTHFVISTDEQPNNKNESYMQTFRKIALYFSFKEDESNGNGYTVENTISKHKESAKSGVHNKWTFTHIQCIVYITLMWIIWADFSFWIAESCVQMNVIFHKTCAHTRIHILHTKKKKKFVLFAWATTIDNEQCSKFCFCLFVCTLHPSCTLQNAFAERVARINELREENEKSYHKSHEMSRKKSLQQQYIVMCAVQTHRRTQNKTKQKNKHL